MRVLFVENREKTRFWEQVATALQAHGMQVGWLVQNPQFAPRSYSQSAEVYLLPFPKRAGSTSAGAAAASVGDSYPELLTDRGRTYFDAGAGHYQHYKLHIQRALQSFKPDVVIGEATLFHELLAVSLCRAAGILYVQPASNRYPQGRFSLLAYDTQVPVLESGDAWTDQQASDLARRIAAGSELPFYMAQTHGWETVRKRLFLAATRGRIWWARIRGERYNTPSAFRKLTLQRALRRNISRWRGCQRLPTSPAKSLLYAMQLQPEANIDVWGKPYVDQVQLIDRMLAAAPADFQVCVKANPKAKYEISEALLSRAQADSRLCLLPFDMTMPEAISQCLGAVTVTGTVGFEAICGKGRVISLRHPIIAAEFPDFHAPTPEEAVKRLIDDPRAGSGNTDLGARLIKRFVSQSFPGWVADPVSYPACIHPDNVASVARAVARLGGTAGHLDRPNASSAPAPI